MLAIRLRVRPCTARCSPRSLGRSTLSSPSSWTTFMSRLTSWLSSPFGPLTETWPGAMSTVTPSGTGMGFLPMRLISNSPDVGHDFAADAVAIRLVAGHHPARRRDDRGAHPALDTRDLG